MSTGDSDIITEDETATGCHHACQGHVHSGPPFIGALRSDHVHHTSRHGFFSKSPQLTTHLKPAADSKVTHEANVWQIFLSSVNLPASCGVSP